MLNLSAVFQFGAARSRYCLFAALLFGVNTFANPSFSGLTEQELFIDEPVEASCVVSSPDMEYHYPQLQASLFQRNTPTPLPPLVQSLQVVCSAPVAALLLSVDADLQSDSAPDTDPTHFGLGSVNGAGRLGYYQVTLDNATVDSAPVKLYQTESPSQLATPQSSVRLKPAVFQGWTGDGQTPAKGQVYAVQITVSPTLNSLQETQGPLVNGGELQGELVLAFAFSI